RWWRTRYLQNKFLRGQSVRSDSARRRVRSHGSQPIRPRGPDWNRREHRMLQRKTGQWPASLEQDLKASGEILELLPIATCICDSAGRIVQYNRRAVELWGRTPEPGQTHDDFTAQNRFFTLEGDLLPRSKVAEVLHTGKAIRDEEVTVQRVNAPSLVVLINIDPMFDAEGRLTGVINCFQDITDRHRMVEALAHSQQDL